MWYRAFCQLADDVPPSELLAHLHGQGLIVEGHFRGDDLGWSGGEIRFGPGGPVWLERWLTAEDDLRDDLNSWAAWLESTSSYSKAGPALMEPMIQAAQLITLRKPTDASDEIVLERLCEAVCGFYATRLEGFWQADGRGFFAADGTRLVEEY